MIKDLFLHGTSLENLESIKSNGFYGMASKQIWCCSGGLNYFWSLRDLCKKEFGSDTVKEGFSQALSHALDSGTFALLQNENLTELKRCVLVLDLTGLEVLPDTSCENMSSAYLVTETVSFSRVKAVYADSENLAYFLPYFYNCAKQMKLFNIDSLDLPRSVEVMASAINSASCELFEEISMLSQDLVKII